MQTESENPSEQGTESEKTTEDARTTGITEKTNESAPGVEQARSEDRGGDVDIQV